MSSQRTLVENEGAPRMKVKTKPPRRKSDDDLRELQEHVEARNPRKLLDKIRRLEARVRELERWKQQHEFDHASQ